MGGRSSFLPGVWKRSEPLEGTGFRCRGTGAAAIYAGVGPTRPSPEVATGWRTSVRFRHQYMASSLSGPGWPPVPQAGSLPPHARKNAAHYSPDGKRIAFESDRSGVQGIWVCDADGSNAVELFSRSGRSRVPVLVTRWATHRFRF